MTITRREKRVGVALTERVALGASAATLDLLDHSTELPRHRARRHLEIGLVRDVLCPVAWTRHEDAWSPQEEDSGREAIRWLVGWGISHTSSLAHFAATRLLFDTVVPRGGAAWVVVRSETPFDGHYWSPRKRSRRSFSVQWAVQATDSSLEKLVVDDASANFVGLNLLRCERPIDLHFALQLGLYEMSRDTAFVMGGTRSFDPFLLEVLRGPPPSEPVAGMRAIAGRLVRGASLAFLNCDCVGARVRIFRRADDDAVRHRYLRAVAREVAFIAAFNTARGHFESTAQYLEAVRRFQGGELVSTSRELRERLAVYAFI
jgi:hypothetical protein